MPPKLPEELHSLLATQLRQLQLTEPPSESDVSRLLAAVNGAYHDFDTNRQMLERALQLSSEELTEANVDLQDLLAERDAAYDEMQLLNEQRLGAAGLLAGGVAHDFNNLLVVIVGACEQQRMLTEGDDPRTELVEQIEGAAKCATALIGQLLAFSRQQVLQPRVIDLNGTITDLEQILRPLVGANIELRWSPEPGLLAINADPSQIEQVVVNLIVNARDAMPSGGTLRMQTSRASGAESQAFSSSGAPLVRLSVSDTGLGIPAEAKSRIFEPFFTTKPQGKGTGLGLSTVYGIVRQSGGFITVDSEVSKGTTFHVFLPESTFTSAAQAR